MKFNVTGMTCAACSARVEKVTRQVPGVEKADVNLLAGTMVVDAPKETAAAIIQAVADAGYGAERKGARPAPEAADDRQNAAEKEMKIRIDRKSVV